MCDDTDMHVSASSLVLSACFFCWLLELKIWMLVHEKLHEKPRTMTYNSY